MYAHTNTHTHTCVRTHTGTMYIYDFIFAMLYLWKLTMAIRRVIDMIEDEQELINWMKNGDP